MVAVKKVVREIQPNIPWHQKAIWSSKNSKKTPPTFGQVIGGGAVALSLFDIVRNVFTSKDDTSTSKKYLIPGVCTALGLFGIATSVRSKTVFESELINRGITNVIKTLNSSLVKNTSLLNVFEVAFQDSLVKAVNRILSKSSPVIARFIPNDFSIDTPIYKELTELTRVSDNFTLDKLSAFIQEVTPRGFYKLLESSSNETNNVLDILCNNKNGIINKDLAELCAVLNNNLFIPQGLSVKLGYNSKRNLFDVHLYTAELFSYTGKPSYYKPCITIPLSPPDLYASLNKLILSINNLKIKDGESIKSANRKVMSTLTIAALSKVKFSDVKSGYFEIKDIKNEQLDSTPIITGTLERSLDRASVDEIRNFLAGLAIKKPLQERSRNQSAPALTATVSNGYETTHRQMPAHTGAVSESIDGEGHFTSLETLEEETLVEQLKHIQIKSLHFKEKRKISQEAEFLKYWLTLAYLHNNFSTINPELNTLKKALKADIRKKGVGELIESEWELGNVSIANNVLILSNKYLKLKYFSELLDINLSKKKNVTEFDRKSFQGLFDLLRIDQKVEMETRLKDFFSPPKKPA